MRIAIVLKQGFKFDAARPMSIESVIRTNLGHNLLDNEIVIIKDRNGGTDHAYGDNLSIVEIGEYDSKAQRAGLIARAIADLDIDYVEVHQDLNTAVHLGGELPGTPLALYRHTNEPSRIASLRRLKRNRRMRKLRAIIAISEACRNSIEREHAGLPADIYVVPNGLERGSWHAAPGAREKLIMYSGRPARHKGFVEFCQALEIVLEKHRDWRAVMFCIGWDLLCEVEDNSPEKAFAPLKRFGDRVVLQKNGAIADVQRMLKKTAIAAVPTTGDDAFSLPAAEAHFAGAAVVSSGRGALREVSGPGALYLEDVTAHHIARALDRLIADPELLQHYAAAGQEYALARLSAEKTSRQLAAARREIVEGWKAGESRRR